MIDLYCVESAEFQAAFNAALKIYMERSGVVCRETAAEEIRDSFKVMYAVGYKVAMLMEVSSNFTRDFNRLRDDLESGCEICLGLVDVRNIGQHSPLRIDHVNHINTRKSYTDVKDVYIPGYPL